MPLNETEEIQKMTAKIKALKLLRQQQNPKNKYNEMNKLKHEAAVSKTADSDSVTTSSKKRSNKRRLHHPNLDSVYVGVAHSPYLTDPAAVYTKDTIRTSNVLRQLNKTGIELKMINDLPFDLQKSKDTFVEALTYAPSFEVRGALSN